MNQSPKIVLASNNAKKVSELLTHLPPHFSLITQAELAIPSPAETGTTFVENAIIKARHAAHSSGLAAIADDSGIEVDALLGQPGIYSARFAGENATDSDNIDRLLAAMNDVEDEARTANFYCVIVMLRHALDPTPIIATGRWPGRILRKPRGDRGFGYDPIFFDPLLGRSAAELSPAEKYQVSHRGQALRALAKELI